MKALDSSCLRLFGVLYHSSLYNFYNFCNLLLSIGTDDPPNLLKNPCPSGTLKSVKKSMSKWDIDLISD